MLDLKQLNDSIRYYEMKDFEGNVIHVRMPDKNAQELIKSMSAVQKNGGENTKVYTTKVQQLFSIVINNNLEERKYKDDYASFDLKKLVIVYYLDWFNGLAKEALEEIKQIKAGE